MNKDTTKEDREKEVLKYLQDEIAKYPHTVYVPRPYEAQLDEHLKTIEEAQIEHGMSLEEVAADRILIAFIDELLRLERRKVIEECIEKIYPCKTQVEAYCLLNELLNPSK